VSETSDERSAVVQLGNDTRAAGVARREVRDLVGDHPRIDDLLLCVSEVVTNAVVHAGSLSHLTLDCGDDHVRVEVVDRSPETLPQPGEPDPSSPSGRGMRLVASLADRWGVEVDRVQKSVWFEFAGVG
jgi:anti-sigma regulatory factor (Ser/Thr protein kinase)